MKAAVCREFGKPLVIEEVNLADEGPGEVRVKVSAVAICHSDITYADGGWGGIQPPWIYAIMSLHNEGYHHTHPVMAKALDCLNDPGWRVDIGEATFIQATNSPVWDTILSLLAFDDAELCDAYPKQIEKAVQWVLDRQVRVKGDRVGHLETEVAAPRIGGTGRRREALLDPVVVLVPPSGSASDPARHCLEEPDSERRQTTKRTGKS